MTPHRIPVIAVDAMGGDFAPRAPVEAIAALSRTEKLHCIAVGDEKKIREIFSRLDHDPSHITVHHCPEVIGMEEPAFEAVSRKPQSSLLVGAELVANGLADVLVSAGNTGACVLACAKNFPLLPGIKKPALAAPIPTRQNTGSLPYSVLLDAGATLKCRADDLINFALMGSVYSQKILQRRHPRIALLNVGMEETKGGKILTEAFQHLKSLLGSGFIGNLEGHEVVKAKADVIICDGFTGNVVLKMAEGVTEIFKDFLTRTTFLWRLGFFFLSPLLNGMRGFFKLADYGGAPLLGFEHILVKAHGRSSARHISNAIKTAAQMVNLDLPGEIARKVFPPAAR